MLVKHRNVPAFHFCPIALPSQARHIPFSFPLLLGLLGHKIYQLRTTICVFFSIANSNIKWKIRQYKRVPDLIITLLLLVSAYSFTCFVGFTDHNWIDMIMWESNREGWRTRGYSCPRATLTRPTIPTFTTFLEVCWNERDGGFI